MRKKLILGLAVSCLLTAKDLSHLDIKFVQRWNYQDICDFAFQNEGDLGTDGSPFHNDTPFHPKDVFPGSVVFLTGPGAHDFFKYIHPHIQNPYFIVYMA